MTLDKNVKDSTKTLEKSHPLGLRTIMELFDVGPGVAISVLSVSSLVIFMAVIFFIRSAPPTSITISTGPDGSVFQKNALKYVKILEGNGVKVKVITSKGSLENIERLANPSSQVDVGMVQAGITNSDTEKLVSLGSISYQPILIFFRGNKLELLSELKGKRIAIGPEGSGARNFALRLLESNGIKEGGETTLLNWEVEKSSSALYDGTIDAAFVMSEGASPEILHKLMRSTDIHLYNFKQANAYSRKIDHLNILDLPEGVIDFGLNIPPHDITLLGPMIELVATKNLHPALSDLLLEAATQVHSRPGVFQHRGDFPVAIEHAIHISDDASRFYKSGKSLLYRFLPYWLASLTSRIVSIFLPLLVLLIPTMKSIPGIFRWMTQNRIHRYYRDLLALEKSLLMERDFNKTNLLRQNFDRIEESVNKMKVPASFADQFYGLRGHIDYVRQLVTKNRV